MRTIAVLLIVSGIARSAAAEGFYDKDSNHLWNRLHHVLMVRSENGKEFGHDNAVPFLHWGAADELLTGEPYKKALATLEEFLASGGEKLITDPLRRAILQHDLWGVFDQLCVEWQEFSPELLAPRAALRNRIAKVMRRLISDGPLPDNFTQAVKSGAFAADFDPEKAERPFLPPDLFDENGPWVQIGAHPFQSPIAAGHADALSGRSAFMVFIRVPGGRAATLDYLDKLNLHRTPFKLEPAHISKGNGGRMDRGSPLDLDPDTPQPPKGTALALARRMVVFNERMKLSVSPILQSVQFRVFRDIKPGRRFGVEEQRRDQPAFEITLRRALLFAGNSGGLKAIEKDETEYPMIPFGRPHDHDREKMLRGPVVMNTCASCHHQNGVFSILTYAGFQGNSNKNPRLLPAETPDSQFNATINFKSKRYDWGVLKGLLEAQP